MSDFVPIRSLLINNVDILLENLSARREGKKNQSDDIFAELAEETKTEIKWKKLPPRSPLEILLQEKNSLGLFLSANPLDLYDSLLEYVRKLTGKKEIVHLVLVDKVKKVFTKQRNMMLTLQLTSSKEPLEGIIFPKYALHFSGKIEENRLYWVLGRLGEKNKAPVAKEAEVDKPKAVAEEHAGESEEAPVESVTELREYVENTKIIVDNIKPFVDLRELFVPFEVDGKPNRLSSESLVSLIPDLDWSILENEPEKLEELLSQSGGLKNQPGKKKTSKTSSSASSSNSSFNQNSDQGKANEPQLLRLPKSLGAQILTLKQALKKEAFPEAVAVRLEIEQKTGWQQVPGTFWLEEKIFRQFQT